MSNWLVYSFLLDLWVPFFRLARLFFFFLENFFIIMNNDKEVKYIRFFNINGCISSEPSALLLFIDIISLMQTILTINCQIDVDACIRSLTKFWEVIRWFVGEYAAKLVHVIYDEDCLSVLSQTNPHSSSLSGVNDATWHASMLYFVASVFSLKSFQRLCFPRILILSSLNQLIAFFHQDTLPCAS